MKQGVPMSTTVAGDVVYIVKTLTGAVAFSDAAKALELASETAPCLLIKNRINEQGRKVFVWAIEIGRI